MNKTATLTYEENDNRERELFALMLSELTAKGVQYHTRRAHGLLEIIIEIGAQ